MSPNFYVDSIMYCSTFSYFDDYIIWSHVEKYYKGDLIIDYNY